MNDTNMTITVNGEKIDYTLEDENTIGEVMKGVSSWLEGAGMLVKALSIDDKPLSDNQWKDRPIDSVHSLRVDAISLRENRIIQLELAQDYFILLKKSQHDNDRESFNELVKSYSELREMLSYILGDGVLSALCPTIDGAFSGGESAIDVTPQFMSEIAAIAGLLDDRHKEVALPKEQAAVAAKTLAELAGELDGVAIHLQTGKDKMAMATIIKLTELLQAFLRCMAWMESSESTAKINKEMNAILSELEEALRAQDTVLIGDLLEYEVKPRLIELPKALTASGDVIP